MIDHRIPLDDFDLAVTECGKGPPILFGHSLTFDHQMFLGLAPRLDADFRLLMADLRGHGQTIMPEGRFSLDDMADDLARALDALQIPRAGYVGHSMGGMVGMRFALRHPDRVAALALLNTSADAEDPGVRDLYHHVNENSRGKPSEPATVEFVLNLMFSARFRAEHPDAVAPFEQILYAPPDKEGVYQAAHAVIWRDSIADRLHEIGVPTLVITADGDQSVPARHGEAIARGIPGAVLSEIADCGHLSPVERPDEVQTTLRGFFHESWSAP